MNDLMNPITQVFVNPSLYPAAVSIVFGFGIQLMRLVILPESVKNQVTLKKESFFKNLEDKLMVAIEHGTRTLFDEPQAVINPYISYIKEHFRVHDVIYELDAVLQCVERAFNVLFWTIIFGVVIVIISLIISFFQLPFLFITILFFVACINLLIQLIILIWMNSKKQWLNKIDKIT